MYYNNQAGNGIPVYTGHPNQRGHGIGSILSSIARVAVPVLSRVGKRVIRGGLQVASDVLDGRSFGDSAKRRVSEAIKEEISHPPAPKRRKVVKKRRDIFA